MPPGLRGRRGCGRWRRFRRGCPAPALLKPAASEIGCALFGGVFGGLAGFAEGGVTAGDEALNQGGRDGEGGGALGGVEDSEAAAGSGTDVEEAAPLLEAGGDGVHRFGDAGQLGSYSGGYLCVLLVDDAEHLQGRKLVDVLGGGVAGFGGKGGEVHVISMMGDAGGVGQLRPGVPSMRYPLPPPPWGVFWTQVLTYSDLQPVLLSKI